ncbi:MAG: RHS repeat protein, partial [bacterium]|nr:RHS repeat protein [bacterium]
MDPSLKRYAYTEGIPVHEQVQFSLGEYLQSGTVLSPRRATEEALWAYIRANNLDCTTLEQLKKAPSVIREDFPFLPSTLRGKILQIDGEATAIPDTFQQKIHVEVRRAGSGALVAWESFLPALYGHRIEIAYQGATADDDATLASYGGIFVTPPYLVDLKPIIKVAGIQQTAGATIGSAEEVEIFVTLTPVEGSAELLVHDGYAGEPSVLLVDFGHLSAPALVLHQEALRAALATGDFAESEVATLNLLAATYMHNLGHDLDDLTDWNWHRVVRLGTEALVAQTGAVVTVGGSPISFTRAETFVDVAGMVLGLFHTGGQTTFLKSTLEAAGAQGSFLEGEVFNEVVEREGIAAVSALTRAQREGQILTMVDGSNVDVVLAGFDLGEEVENRILSAVASGRIAWVPEALLDVNRWSGAGYILEDPITGAAAFLLSGGYSGGADTGAMLEEFQELPGSESWLEADSLRAFVRLLLELLGGGDEGSFANGPGTNQSDPINLSTGNLWFTETDLTIQARGLPIVWGRTYNSRSEYLGPLGYGWTFSYGERLEEQPDGSMLYYEADGTEHAFAPEGTGDYTAPPGKHLSLSKEATGYTLRAKNGLLSAFDLDGRLLALAERNGNEVTLGYDAAGQLTSLTDAAGRPVLTVTTAAGKITQLTDVTGRTVVFGYTGDDLTAVTDVVGRTWSYAYDADHNLIARSDPVGNTNTYAYDAHDRCTRHVDPLGNAESFSFPSRASRAVLTDRRGFDSYFEFDHRGRAVLQVDSLGNASRSTWDDDNNRTNTTDPRGGVTTRTFDDRGNPMSVINPLGETTTFTYDPAYSQVLTATKPGGQTVTNAYDGSGNLRETSQVVSDVLVTQRYTYDDLGQLQTETDANGHTTTYVWDATKGSVESRTDPTGHTTGFNTDALGRITTITHPESNAVMVDWDDRDLIRIVTDSFGNNITITYDETGRQMEVTTPRGSTTTEYDAAGRLVAVTDPLGNTTRTEYDAAGHPKAQIDAKGNRNLTTYYDAVGRPAAVVDALGNVWTYGYCAEIMGEAANCSTCGGGRTPGLGNFCELTDPLGNVTRQDFDALGRVQRITDPLGHQTVIAYDPLGQRHSVTDALDRTTRYEHDSLGRLTAVIEANGARTEYTYDANGNLVNTKDAEGRDWRLTYDELNRLKTESDPLVNTTEYFYSALGNLERKEKPDGQEITYSYDIKRLTAINHSDGAVETFGYDTLGRRTTMGNAEVSVTYVLDELDRQIQMINHTLSQTIGYQYDENGNLIQMQGPLGTVQYFYDGLDRLVEQQDPTTGKYRYEYDGLGRRTALQYPNGLITEYRYDGASRLKSVLTRNSHGAVVDGYSYAYDPVGNQTSITSTATFHQGMTNHYRYDEVNRLTGSEGGLGRIEEYTYDRVGNRLTLQDQAGTTTYSYDSANRLLNELRVLPGAGSAPTTYTWDANGNLTSKAVGPATTSYRWDALNRLTEITESSELHSYGYSPDGIRVRETTGGLTRRLLYSMEDVLVTVDEDNDFLSYFLHGPDIDEPLAEANGTEIRYFHRNGIRSITALSGLDEKVLGGVYYAAFGAEEDRTGTLSRYGFTGREMDPSGLVYFRARYYQPETGRFLSEDPGAGAIQLPISLHNFVYAYNNPLVNVDPSGEVVLAFALGGAALVGAALAAAIELALIIILAAVIAVVLVYLIYVAIGLIEEIIENPWIFQSRRRGRDPGLRISTDPWPPIALVPEKNDCKGFLKQARELPWSNPMKVVNMIMFWLCERDKP